MIGMLPSPRSSEATPPKVRDYLSWSAVSSFTNCPLRYFFKYVLGLPERTVSPSLIFGQAIHKAVELHLNELMAGNEAPSAEALLGEYDAAWNEYDPTEVNFGKESGRQDLLPLAQRVIGAFQASELAKPAGAILGVEEELRGPVVLGCPDILGRLDIIVEEADAVIVTDLKTARSRWSRDQVEDSAGQLLLYHELAKSLVPRKRLKLQFAVLTKTKEPTVDLHEVPVDVEQIDRTKRIVERVWKAIEAQHFYPAPSPTQCPTCPFRGPCREWR
jgi:CRISPR/Cas system-associated exonuclease Cas4 (RecB family)